MVLSYVYAVFRSCIRAGREEAPLGARGSWVGRGACCLVGGRRDGVALVSPFVERRLFAASILTWRRQETGMDECSDGHNCGVQLAGDFRDTDLVCAARRAQTSLCNAVLAVLNIYRELRCGAFIGGSDAVEAGVLAVDGGEGVNGNGFRLYGGLSDLLCEIHSESGDRESRYRGAARQRAIPGGGAGGADGATLQGTHRHFADGRGDAGVARDGVGATGRRAARGDTCDLHVGLRAGLSGFTDTGGDEFFTEAISICISWRTA